MKMFYQGAVFMALGLLYPLKLFALPDIDNPVTALFIDNPFSYQPGSPGFSYGQQVPLEISYDTQSVQVAKNARGVRELDMTNMCHFNLVKSRLDKAEISEEEFPHLYRNMELKKQQQQLEKLFPTPMQISTLADKPEEKKSRHLFLAMNIAISLEDNSPYLVIHTKNSVQGGTFTTYLDLLLEDGSGKQLAPMEHTLEFYEGENTLTTAIVPLVTLKQDFPGLEMIYASSYVETQGLDGTIASAIKHSRYPFSWRYIEQAFGHLLVSGSEAGHAEAHALDESSVNPFYHYLSQELVDKVRDNICLTSGLPDCDLPDEQVPAQKQGMAVHMPFGEQLEIPHEITGIYPLQPLADTALGIDETTALFLEAPGNSGNR
ncbi:hypothetical protein SG34_012175 [Thalassomonas viridans]|uniref:Uncharacterized protein n=1 Tax=Thalassomonas viridans TaxID=137584 RepID=A0AAE9Z7I6_9GAMM|nr:hypothetical protein [Thalassomonas viridans]WDE07569.1 hypothetical protein SG34_012175 [Thalassomonas viridans]